MDRSAPIAVDDARWNLFVIWTSFSGVLLLLMLVQTLTGFYVVKDDAGTVVSDQTKDAWAWMLPRFMPALTLMVGIFAAAAFTSAPADPRKVNRRFYRLALTMSLVYLGLVLATLFELPFVRGQDPIPLFKNSTLWLLPVQGLTATIIGALFKKPKSSVA